MRHAQLIATRLCEPHAARKRPSRWAAADRPRHARSGDESKWRALTAAFLLLVAAVGLIVLALIGLWQVAPAGSASAWSLDAPAACGTADLLLMAVPEGHADLARLGPALTC
jgi:hypothetical protein